METVSQRPFVAGCAALARDDLDAAVRLFDDAAKQRPDDLEVRLYAAWARLRLAESITPAERDAVEALAARALSEHRSLALPLCILGYAALRRGELHAARSLFRHASDAAPTLLDARRGERVAELRLARGERATSKTLARQLYAPRLALGLAAVLSCIALALTAGTLA